MDEKLTDPLFYIIVACFVSFVSLAVSMVLFFVRTVQIRTRLKSDDPRTYERFFAGAKKFATPLGPGVEYFRHIWNRRSEESALGAAVRGLVRSMWVVLSSTVGILVFFGLAVVLLLTGFGA